MSKEIALPSGHKVVLKDPEQLLMRDRKLALKATEGKKGMMMIAAFNEGLIAAMVESWSFDLIPPSINLDSLEQLNPKDFQMLTKECEVAAQYLFPETSESEATDMDPKALIANLEGLEMFG
jgi:hypothetical protein